MTLEGLAAVEQFAARFVFDRENPAVMQQELAQHIEAAIDRFKATEMQDLIARTLRRELRQRVVAAIDSWSCSYDYAQPAKPPEDDTATP